MIVVFYEDNEQFVVRALDGVEQRWQEEVKKQHLNIWRQMRAGCADRTRCFWLRRKQRWCDASSCCRARQSRRGSAPWQQTR